MVDGIPQVKAPPWLDPDQKWREASSVHKQPQKPASWRAKTRALKEPATLGCTAPPQQLVYPPSSRTAPVRQRPANRPVPDISWASEHVTIIVTS